MNIAHLPVDLLSPICDKIYAADVLRLVTVGNKALGLNVRHSVKNLLHETDGFTKYPFSVFNLPYLESLTIRTAENMKAAPLKLDNRPIFPNAVQKCLKTVELEFAQSFLVLKDENFFSNTPNLVSLCLTRSLVDFEIVHLIKMPSSITKLVLRSLKTKYTLPTLQLHQLAQHLPQELVHLEYNCFSIAPMDGGGEMPQISWPKNMRNLIADCSAPVSLLVNLPPTIERFHAIIISKDFNGPILMSQMPKSLAYFVGYYRGSSPFEIVLDAPMPPNLEFWQLSLAVPSSKNLEYLNRKLRKLDCFETLRIAFPEIHLAELLPKVEHCYRHLEGTLPNSSLDIPEEATEVFFYGTPDLPQIKQVPNTATFLSASTCDPSYFGAFPRHLKSLSTLSSGKEGYFVKPEFWAMLPPTLVTLKCNLSMLSSVECLSELPVTLEFLSLAVSEPKTQEFSGSKFPANLHQVRSDISLSKFLPPSLRKLSFQLDYPQSCAWTHWVSDLTHIKRLTGLHVSIGCHSGTETPGFTPLAMTEVIPKLSPTLIELEIPIDIYPCFPESLFSNLPPKLHGLNLRFFDGSHCLASEPVTDQHFSHLPSSLIDLSLQYSSLPIPLDNITPALLKNLPRKLMTLCLFSPKQTEVDDLFFSSDKWQGLSWHSNSHVD